MKRDLYSFDRLAKDDDTYDSWSAMSGYRRIANAEERLYIKSLRPDKLIEYLEVRNKEEFLNRI